MFLIHVNNMRLQVQHGSLLQFADDTCLICCGNTDHDVAQMLSEDLKSELPIVRCLSILVKCGLAYVLFNLLHYHLAITVDGQPPDCVDTQKYLGLHMARFQAKLEKSCCQHM